MLRITTAIMSLIYGQLRLAERGLRLLLDPCAGPRTRSRRGIGYAYPDTEPHRVPRATRLKPGCATFDGGIVRQAITVMAIATASARELP